MAHNFKSDAKRKITATLLLLGFLFLPIGGAANHYCFDGQEAAVSVHFDHFNGHDAHEKAEQHIDLETQLLAEHLVSKYTDFDYYLPPAVVFHDVNPASPVPFSFATLIIAGHASLWSLTPPLRAPPELS
jgi:hypothetical protein